MAIEAELKALVRDPDAVAAKLRTMAEERAETYHDVYFDRLDHGIAAADQELRVRAVESESGVRGLLTFKDSAVDRASDSKPEFETTVDDAATLRRILDYLGFVVDVALTKNCRNYRFEARGRSMLATLVTVPEISGTFIEVETQVEAEDVQAALSDVRVVLAGLGISESDLTTEKYTDAVRQARG